MQWSIASSRARLHEITMYMRTCTVGLAGPLPGPSGPCLAPLAPAWPLPGPCLAPLAPAWPLCPAWPLVPAWPLPGRPWPLSGPCLAPVWPLPGPCLAPAVV
jgi:hypothetical protein